MATWKRACGRMRQWVLDVGDNEVGRCLACVCVDCSFLCNMPCPHRAATMGRCKVPHGQETVCMHTATATGRVRRS